LTFVSHRGLISHIIMVQEEEELALLMFTIILNYSQDFIPSNSNIKCCTIMVAAMARPRGGCSRRICSSLYRLNMRPIKADKA
jgi:hypothetical protein